MAKGPEPASRQKTECCTQPGKASANNPLWDRLATGSRAEAPSSAPTIVHDALGSSGQPLEPNTRVWMESHLGYDLGDVRVHTDAQAAESARAVNALAYTVGRDIVFDAGQYVPETSVGRRSIAHELAHVAQQSSGAAPAGKLQRQAKDKTAQGIIDKAKDKTTPDIATRAKNAVWDILKAYYSSEASKISDVVYEENQPGLNTTSVGTGSQATGKIAVGKYFVEHMDSFARRVLQVGHELQHVDQYRTGKMSGKPNRDEREFLAFEWEAGQQPKAGTGRLADSMRRDLIDCALGYFYCLPDDKQKTYDSKKTALLTLRDTVNGTSGNSKTDPPDACRRCNPETKSAGGGGKSSAQEQGMGGDEGEDNAIETDTRVATAVEEPDEAVQTKSALGSPGDSFEQEADRFADAVTTGSSMDPVRLRTTSGPQRKCAQCGGDASGGCAQCADEDAKLQLKADGPGANSQVSARTQSQIAALSGDGAGRRLPQALQSYYEPRLGIELSGIRLHTDRLADALARQVNALAFTYGRDIAFRAGYYAPDSDSGKRLLSHELAHVVQQQGASAVPALQRKAADASVPVGPTNPDYVNKYSSKILLAISERIQAVGVPQPHARIRWSMEMADVGQAIGEAIYDYVRAVPDTDLKRLMLLSYPADLFALVDRARRGPEGGRLDAVRVAIATAFDEPLMASIQRMGMRLCVQMDIHGGNKPQASSIVASSPLDGVIAGVLVKPGLTSYTFKKKGTPDDTRGKPFAKGARVVKYEWLGPRDPALWNWIKVTSPADATAEDVANTALAGGEAGDTEQAYRIAVSPPYFGIPFETARLIPEAEKYAPTDLRIKLSSGPGPRVADPSALARSVVSDDAALTQAPAPAKDDLPVDRALPRIDLQLEFIRTQLQPWGADAPLAGATAFVKRRYADLTQDKKHAHRWQAVLAAQERILHTASADLADVVQQLTEAKASPSDVPGPIMQLLIAYARAAGASHIHEEARAALAEARRLRDFLPIALADARIEDATAQVARQREAEASAKAPEKGADRTLGNLPDLMTRSADLRLQAIRGEKLDPDDVEMLSVDASETDLRAYLLTLATQARTVMDKADDVGLDQGRYPSGAWSVHMISELILKNTRGWMDHLDQARKWVGPARGLSAKQTDAKRMKDAIAYVTSEVSKFSTQLNEQGDYLKWAYEQIQDKELRNLIFSMAVQMGVMLVTGQALGAIGTAVRGIALAGELGAELREASLLYRGAGIIAEAAVNTGVQAAMGEKVGVREFAENTLGIVLTHAALKPFQGLLRDSAAIEGEIRTWGQLAKRGGRAAAELVIETGAGIGAAGVAHALTHGGETSAMSSEEWVMQGLSLAAGKFVHQTAAKMHDRIQVAKHDLNTNAFDELLSKVEALERRATKKVSSPEEANELMAERHKLLVEERNLYGARPEGEKAHAEVEKELAATAEQFVDAPLQLAHLSPVVEGQIYEGSSAQIKNAIAAAEAAGVPMVSVGDPQDGVWRVGKRTIKIVEVVPEQQIETALKHIQEHPELIQDADKPGKRHAPAGEGHEVVEVSGPSGIVCEFESMGRRRVACPWPRGKGPKVGKEILDAWPTGDIGPGQPTYQLTGDNGQFRSSRLGYHVYEYFNERGELLYVGKSGSISEAGSRVEHVEPGTREAPTNNWINRLRDDHIHKFWITEARFVRVTYDLSEPEMWALEKSRISDARENIQPGKYPREFMGSYLDDVKHAGRRPQVYFGIEAQRTRRR